MSEIRVRDLGLAAYIKASGAVLLTVRDGYFHFDSDIDLVEWEVTYLNTCCYTHDSEVMSLRKLRNKHK